MITLSLLLSGCMIKDFVSDKPEVVEVKSDSSILVGNYDKKIDSSYTIKNPLSFGFTGNAEVIYEKDCLDIIPSSLVVQLKAKQEMAYSSSISLKTNLPEKCFGTQEISIVLSDQTKENVLSHKELMLTIAKRN
jgi:hypothetical protein